MLRLEVSVDHLFTLVSLCGDVVIQMGMLPLRMLLGSAPVPSHTPSSATCVAQSQCLYSFFLWLLLPMLLLHGFAGGACGAVAVMVLFCEPHGLRLA